MAANPIPDQLDQLMTLAEDMADGAAALAGPIGIQQNTEVRIRADMTAAANAEAAYQNARSTKKTLMTAQTVADSNGKAYIGTAKDVLGNYLGKQWSASWTPTGFVNGSLAVPGTIAERQALLSSLRAYFNANPAQQNAPLNVTAARADTLFIALSDARSAVNNASNAAGAAKALRDQKVVLLRNRVSGTVGELDQLISDEDPRWHAFGLNRPSDPETPEVPEGLVLTAGPAGSVLADWANARRAARYRVFRQIVGVDADFVHAGTVTESDATLSGLPSGATVKVRVTAVNDAGESAPSVEVQIVVP